MNAIWSGMVESLLRFGETLARDLSIQDRLLPAVGFFDEFAGGVLEGAGVVNSGAKELGREADVVAGVGGFQEADERARPHFLEMLDERLLLVRLDEHLHRAGVSDSAVDEADAVEDRLDEVELGFDV